ncbi:MAG: recombinase family protein [Prevotella sp.]|nr:recombinase family protein [Prevotella sp.]
MSERKIAVYARVGNAEQLGETTDNRVFLYCRQSYDDSHFMNQQQEHLLRHCADKGYQAAGSTAVVASAKDEKENMLRLAQRLKSGGIKTMLISDPSRISLDPQDFIEIVSAFHKNGVTIEYRDGDGNTRNLLEVLEQLRTANLDLVEPECDEDEAPDESPHIQM